MSKKYYRVYFDWSCTPETHWGEPCDEEVVIESYEDYEDGEMFKRNLLRTPELKTFRDSLYSL